MSNVTSHKHAREFSGPLTESAVLEILRLRIEQLEASESEESDLLLLWNAVAAVLQASALHCAEPRAASHGAAIDDPSHVSAAPTSGAR